MNQPTVAPPVQFEDYLGNPLNRGDIIAFTYDKYGAMYTAVVQNARKTPKMYTLTIGHAMYSTVTSQTTLDRTTLSDAAPKFSRVLIIPDSTPNVPQIYLDEATRLRSDGQPLVLPEKVVTMHTFDDFEGRWMKGLHRSVDKLIENVEEVRKNNAPGMLRNSYMPWNKQPATVRYTTAFGPDTYESTVRVELNPQFKTRTIHVSVSDKKARYNSKVSFTLEVSPYDFQQISVGDFDGKQLRPSDIEAAVKVLINA